MAKPTLTIKLVFGLIIFLSFLYISVIRVDPDLGWHIKVGEWQLEHNEIQRTDIYTHTMPGFRWVNHEWLVDSVFAWARINNLWPLVQLFFSILAFIPFAVWIKRARTWSSLWFLLLFGLLMLQLTGVRPQMISFVLFFFAFELLKKIFLAQPSRSFLFALPFVFLAWSYLHGAFPSGLLLFAIFIGCSWYESYRAENSEEKTIAAWNRVRLPVAIFLVSIVFTFLTPLGSELQRVIIQSSLSAETNKYILEWQPALGFSGGIIPVIVGIFAAFMLLFRKRYPLPLFVSSLVFFLLFLKSLRMGPLFLVTAAPIFWLGIGYATNDIRKAWEHKTATPQFARLFRIVSGLNFNLISGLFLLGYAVLAFSNRGFSYPESAVRFLREEVRRETPVVLFNEYAWGGHLIDHAPEIKIFIDGRMPHWVDASGHSAMKDYVKLLDPDTPDAWREVFRKYGVNTALIKNSADEPRQTTISASANMLSHYINTHPLLKRIFRFLFGARAPNLAANLVQHNWSILYEDSGSIILRCDELCW